jgi:hypothetical protein
MKVAVAFVALVALLGRCCAVASPCQKGPCNATAQQSEAAQVVSKHPMLVCDAYEQG